MDPSELAVSTLVYHDLPLVEALRILAQQGFATVDIASVPGPHSHLNLHRNGYIESREFDDVRRLLEQEKLRVQTVYGFPGNLHHSDPGSTLRVIANGITTARELGAGVFCMPAGQATYADHFPDAAVRAGALLREAADAATGSNVSLALEAPHSDTLASTLEEAAALFEAIADPRILITLDSSHLWASGSHNFGAALTRLRGVDVAGFHLRDAAGASVTVTPGKGDIPFGAVIRELRAAGYRGGFTLELEYRYLPLAKRRRELSLARRHLQTALMQPDDNIRDGRLPRLTRARRLLTRTIDHPVEEVARHEALIGPAKMARSLAWRVLPVPVFEGRWRNRRYLGGRELIRSRPAGSVLLARTPSPPLRVGIIGAGNAGQMHGPGYRCLRGVEVVGVIDVQAQRARRLARRLGCDVYESIQSLIREGRIDVASVCTREFLHRDTTIELLEAGVDVFCEKILATRLEHAKEMVEAADSRGRTLAVNYNYRFLAGVTELKRMIDTGRFGRLRMLKIFAHAFTYHHALDLMQHLGGSVGAIGGRCRLDDVAREFGGTDWALYDPDIPYVPSDAALTLEFENGALGSLTSTWQLPDDGLILTIEAVLDDAAVALNGITKYDALGRVSVLSDGRARTWSGFAMSQRPFCRGFEYTFACSIEEFMNAYVSGGRPSTPGSWGVEMIEFERAVARATATPMA
jgi:predicted dehydrogenase/sugar phosphate isomerase/epimerase